MKETLRISLKLHIEVSTQKVVKVKVYKLNSFLIL